MGLFRGSSSYSENMNLIVNIKIIDWDNFMSAFLKTLVVCHFEIVEEENCTRICLKSRINYQSNNNELWQNLIENWPQYQSAATKTTMNKRAYFKKLKRTKDNHCQQGLVLAFVHLNKCYMSSTKEESIKRFICSIQIF